MKKIPSVVECRPGWLCGDVLNCRRLLRPEMRCLFVPFVANGLPSAKPEETGVAVDSRPSPVQPGCGPGTSASPALWPRGGDCGHSLDIVWLWPCE